MIKVVFFAALREQLACSELSLSQDEIDNIKQLKQVLITKNPKWQSHLDNGTLLYANNKTIVDEQHLIVSGDEVAFFPPVTGG